MKKQYTLDCLNTEKLWNMIHGDVDFIIFILNFLEIFLGKEKSYCRSTIALNSSPLRIAHTFDTEVLFFVNFKTLK